MFLFTDNPSSGKFEQCLVKNYKNDSIVSVGMDKVGFIAAYSDQLCVCVVQCTDTVCVVHCIDRVCVVQCIDTVCVVHCIDRVCVVQCIDTV